ncbi:OmpA family protein [Proteinivorax hydrogeniformans]|uniref:OmpA family protein n=1 Tax=Proteinivorax hydrogeniformans TaxID=1826727 RepID=A0AAU8HR00_9FIRM
MRRRRRHEESSKGQQNWLLTYSDVITLVLCMFVMLYSFSTIDAQKFEQLVQSLNQSFSGVLDGGKIVDPADDLDNLLPPDAEGDEEEDELRDVFEEIEELVKQHGLEEEVAIGYTPIGIEITFDNATLFDSGSAELREESYDVLENIGEILSEVDNLITVEGHTDDVPMNSAQFPSNWELSSSRAISVVRYLKQTNDIKPHRLSATGYGEYNPIATNETERGRQKNRRVNVVILKSEAQ